MGTEDALIVPPEDDEPLAPRPDDELPVAVDASVWAADFEAGDRPGATAETSAAKPAVSAAVPTITHRRVRLTRARAASRASTARDRLSFVVIRCLLPIIRFPRTENQRRVRPI